MARMISPISSGPSPPMLRPRTVDGTGNATPEGKRTPGLRGPDASRCSAAVHRRAGPLGRGGGGLHLLQHRAQLGRAGLQLPPQAPEAPEHPVQDRKSTRLNSSHANISYAVFCLKQKKTYTQI